jgi:UDPglucose 6-dehydrogenase
VKVCVIGTGYVGLVAGASLADMGHDVVCCDIDPDRIAVLQAGGCPLHEPGLDRLCAHNVQQGRLSFSGSVAASVAGAAVVMLAVGTPTGEGGQADLGALLQAAEAVADALTAPSVLVVKSTVPVGTGDRLERLVRERARHDLPVVSNPEFLKQGDAVSDFMKPDRIVVGTDDPRALSTLSALYAPFNRTSNRMMVMDRRSAELTKYASNAMLATRISFMNELSTLCDEVGADIEQVRRAMGADGRIGPRFLYAGAGFGGSCFGKDLRAVVATGEEAGVQLQLLQAVLEVNERQKRVLGDKLIEHFGGTLQGKRIAVWGLSFKPGTDDLRESASLVFVEQLLRAGASVAATDPQALEAARKRLGDRVELLASPYAAAEGADALALLTEWHEYRCPSFARLRELLRQPVLFDGRNQWDPAETRALGFTYYGIGRS